MNNKKIDRKIKELEQKKLDKECKRKIKIIAKKMMSFYKTRVPHKPDMEVLYGSYLSWMEKNSPANGKK